MIIPKEIPHKHKLHSYYLKFEKFVAAMQEEIGSGCIYCRSMRQEHMIYFNAHELVNCVAEDRGQPPRVYRQLGDVIEAFKVLPFHVSVHYLDNHAVYFWGQLPPYSLDQASTAEVNRHALANLVDRYKADRFSGFFDIAAPNGQGGLLFLQDGTLAGGSYAWGRGGLSPSKQDYRRLFDLVDNQGCTIEIGTFTPDAATPATEDDGRE
jgi:hypothetical protein